MAGIWRIAITPIDLVKTSLQVNGKSGWNIVMDRVKSEGISVMYSGAMAASAATFVGHFPWFYSYNYLSSILPSVDVLIHSVDQVEQIKGKSFFVSLSLVIR